MFTKDLLNNPGGFPLIEGFQNNPKTINDQRLYSKFFVGKGSVTITYWWCHMLSTAQISTKTLLLYTIKEPDNWHVDNTHPWLGNISMFLRFQKKPSCFCESSNWSSQYENHMIQQPPTPTFWIQTCQDPQCIQRNPTGWNQMEQAMDGGKGSPCIVTFICNHGTMRLDTGGEEKSRIDSRNQIYYLWASGWLQIGKTHMVLDYESIYTMIYISVY